VRAIADKRPTEGPLLRVKDLTKSFPISGGFLSRQAEYVRAVDGVSFAINSGETLGLVGESGCGKSTTGRCILRLIEPSSGEVWFEGKDVTALDRGALRALSRDMQIIFQDPYASLDPRMTVGAIIGEALTIHQLAKTRREFEDRVVQLLETVGLNADHMRRYPHEFSGGQRQRIGIARALAVEPRLVVCDEAVSALDVSVQAQVVNLLQDLQRRYGLAYLFIAHDLAVVKHIADRIAVMYLGRIVETAPKAALFAAPRHPYTQALLEAIPRPEPGATRSRRLVGGDVPSMLTPPSGCHFHTRCPHARERCRVEAPALASDADGGRAVACHYWREIAPPADRPARTTGPSLAAERLAWLQAAFASVPAPGPAAPAVAASVSSGGPSCRTRRPFDPRCFR